MIFVTLIDSGEECTECRAELGKGDDIFIDTDIGDSSLWLFCNTECAELYSNSR